MTITQINRLMQFLRKKSPPTWYLDALFKYQRPFLLLILLITVVLGYFSSRLEYEYDIEQLFPINDPELAFHRETQEKFALPQDMLILGVENSRGIFNRDFLQRLDGLTSRLGQHEMVQTVNSPVNQYYFVWSPFRDRKKFFLHPNDPARYEQDSILIHAYRDVAPKFISRQHTAICSYIFLKEALNEDTKEEMRSFVQAAIEDIGFEKYYLYGDVYVKDSFVEDLEVEMYWLSGLSMLVILIILFFSFRSLWGVVIPIAVVILAVVWTLGTMRAFGVPINLMTVLIPTIVSIISLSDVIHVMNRLNEQSGINKQEAIKWALKDVAMAIFLTSVTTGLGFFTLSYSNIRPFIEFGVFTTIGVAYAYLLAIFVLPLLLNLAPFKKRRELEKMKMNSFVTALHRFTKTRPVFILGLTALLFLLSFFGMSKLRINSYLYEELSADDPFSETLNFFENHFSGIRTFDLYLQIADTSKTLLDMEVLEQIELLEAYLLEEYGLHDVYSIGTQVKRANRYFRKGDPEAFVLPTDANLLKSIRRELLANSETFGLKAIMSEDRKEGRITGKMEDLGSAEIRRRNQAFTDFISENMDPALLSARLTGHTLLLDKSNQLITYKLLYGLLFAIGVVSLLMGWLFRSGKIVILAIIPNILPLLMVLGIIGWADMGLKMSTAIIFTIVFGIAVDDTIHFLTRLNNELKKGLEMEEAIRATYLSTGKAMIITSLILMFGFGVLLFSSFQTTFITGLLVSLALLFALFADLMVLPVLLRKYYC
jgi:hydrophobe/amphiphile efflux-3 (HAE3) family protein